jgi:hypothetical protein
MTLGEVAFHFLLLAAGEAIKIDGYVTPQKLQDYIVKDDAFGIRPPLDQCGLALRLLADSGFIITLPNGESIRNKH